jgi:hypothetical protein
MLLTEKQAALTWCPRMDGRAWEHMGKTTPPDCVGPEFSSCIGPKCMAWRWKADPDARAAARVEGGAEVEPWDACEGQGRGTLQAPLGYCGLAGPLELLR